MAGNTGTRHIRIGKVDRVAATFAAQKIAIIQEKLKNEQGSGDYLFWQGAEDMVNLMMDMLVEQVGIEYPYGFKKEDENNDGND